ncbi:MAG: biopolymer transporter ExbD [Chitinophagaceae bacterium]|nr:biopolymer transporter ExbD [Chitinophagaceae bacterium]MCW5904116.1 biopolymer transporter ExbD [Chitinophagaceae bacterium]
MAELDTSSGGGHKKKGPGVKKSKKMSTRVDLTPMVDLGFLLLTFFIFTTTMSLPTSMNLFLPKDTDDPEQQNKIKDNSALTVLLGKDNNVFYYEGMLDNANISTNFRSSNFGSGEDGIRTVILKKKRSTDEKDFMVVIKPTDECTYKNVVDILDEMTINVVKRYAMVDISDVEAQLVKATEAAGGQ